MSDRELELLRLKKLAQMQRNMAKKTIDEKPKTQVEEDPKAILDQFFFDRAWEVFDAAKYQYPEPTAQIEKMLIKLIKAGRIREKISGGELYELFRRLGLRVKMETHIRVLEDGKVKSLEQKIREETSEECQSTTLA